MRRPTHIVSLAILTLLLFSALIPAQPVAAAGATLELTKRALTPTVNSGDVAVFALDYRCASITEDCRNVVVSDLIASEFSGASGNVQLIGTIHTQNESYDQATRTATWTFVDPLPAGSTGTLELRVRFRPEPHPTAPWAATAPR
ncbi:MAG: DUF11 domain-containing protein [Oscillochloris sp.]|nr:DUF11 domain-containing protein [Oscillochloris sp.]